MQTVKIATAQCVLVSMLVLLVASEKLQKETVSFVMSVLHGTWLPHSEFSRNMVFENFSEICQEN
jgi:hypothetical protein